MAALLAASSPAFHLAQADAPAAVSAPAPDADAEEPLPPGAPTDDYAFLGWCYGALSRHIELRPAVWSEVERIERAFPDPDTPVDQALAGYDAQKAAGEVALKDYDRAMGVAEATGRTGGIERAVAVQAGRDTWQGSDTIDARQLAQLWMSWALPARCGDTANKFLGRTVRTR